MLTRTFASCLLMTFALTALAQQAAPPPPLPPPPLAVPNPNYVTILMEQNVDRPIAEVWQRVGKFCDIAEWLMIQTGCAVTSGKDGEVGSVRSVANEILVGRTEYSYTYTQPVREGRPYNLYHGTLEARAIDAKTTKLIYTLMYDNSLVQGDEAAKQAEIERRRSVFTRALANMKTLAEGGTLAKPPAR